ncbi:MAG: M36 family metallopeptidase, partial [Pyrinomonadaceae bacterium]
MKTRSIFRNSLIGVVVATILLSSLFVSSAQIGVTPNTGGIGSTVGQTTSGLTGPTRRLGQSPNRPKELDVRGMQGVPKGLGLRRLTGAQVDAIKALETSAGSKLNIQYNGLTATPRHMYSYGTYLSSPSRAEPETIARDFISRWRAIFRFNQADVDSLRLKSRATIPDMGTTVLLFEQVKDGLSVYKGEVLVNVNRAGQIMSVGGESFPQMPVTNLFTLPPAQAVTAAAAALGIVGFSPQYKGTKKVLNTFGDLPQQYLQGERFAGGGTFTDDITVTKVIFPLGAEGRPAYLFTLTTPQYQGIMWNNLIDAQTGAVLRRSSLTAFYGGAGGGTQNNRRASFRPDVQDLVESYNPAGTAAGKVFDGEPTTMSGSGGFGRPAARGQQPSYAAEGTTATPGRGFRRSWVTARNEAPYALDPGQTLFSQIYNTPFGGVLRGLPDASNPTAQSPFGWFYLPTANGGAEVTASNGNRATTRSYGYSMHPEAKTRNLAANSPAGDGDQPFSSTVTPLASGVILADGRNLSSVIQSNYTEGNNVLVADDRANDNETTHGIKGYSNTRQFLSNYFNYTMSYEFGGADAAGDPVVYPASANPDVYPGTVTLFYYNNVIHDYLYSIGFTESLFNFQQDNFGKGGAGSDGISAQVQDGSGTDNANFSSPNDGSTPRMQMFLFTDGSFRRSDGDFDFDVVAHEHYHGVSNRSVGKGQSDCLGVTLVGESGGMGEGWSDFVATSMSDDNAEGEYATGEFDVGIRHLPYTNYRYSYRTITGAPSRRDQAAPGTGEQIFTPFEVHDVGENWASVLWDMRELMIVKQKVNNSFPGIFFDGTRRFGSGTPFFIGDRQVQSLDAQHPINYRSAFNTASAATIIPAQHAVRPGALAG